MDESADVVVVGGGVLGTSIAWHLRELGAGRVVLLERDTLGSGSTGKSAGGFRAQFADELNVRIALRSLRELEAMDGVHLHRDGYLFLLDDEADVAEFRRAAALQRSLGVPTQELDASAALAIVPQLDVAGVLAATFCELDGYVTPDEVVQWYARGLDARQGCPATGFRVRDGRLEGVLTPDGTIATGTVVCAAGAWSREVAALAGVDLPVHGERRCMWFTPQDGGLPARVPLTIDFGSGFYFHREGPGLVFGGREQELEEVAVHAAARLPVLAELPVQSGWWGYYEVSPDHNAIVGRAATPAGFLYATGFSGHGFQQAPAVGEHVAELVLGRQPTLDLAAFSVDRFARGEERLEAFVV